MTISSSKSISLSNTLPVSSSFNGVFGLSAVLTPLPFETEIIVDDAGLAVKTGMGPTKGKFREVLEVSKLDIPPKNGELLKNVVPPKIDVQAGIFILGELTGAKIGANVADEYKTEVIIGEVTIHTAGGRDVLGKVTAAVDNLVAEDVVWGSVEEGVTCSSVDEVLGTCISET